MENRKKKKSKKNNQTTNNQNIKTNTTSENTEVLDHKAAQTAAENTSAPEANTEEKIQPVQPQDEEKTSENRKTTQSLDSMIGKDIKDFSADHVKGIAINAAKILLPVAACAIVIAVIISYAGAQKAQVVDNTIDNGEIGPATASVAALNETPLAENAYTDVNGMMNTFYNALASGDMDTVRAVKDYNSDKEIIAYEKKSEFIERYDNIKCYTKPGIEEDSYFVYVTYDVKIQDIDTEAPGLNAFYVYTSEDGSLMIDGDTEENIKAAFKLVTNQDDVVDLYNKINVDYNEAVASDEALDQFLSELPQVLKESVGVELAKLETQMIRRAHRRRRRQRRQRQQPQRQSRHSLYRRKRRQNQNSRLKTRQSIRLCGRQILSMCDLQTAKRRTRLARHRLEQNLPALRSASMAGVR